MEIFKKDVNLIHGACFFKQHYAPFVSEISFHRRRFVILDYFIKENQFTVKIDYDKEQFGHLIDQYVHEMLLAIRANQILRDCVWWNDTVFVFEQQVSEYFGNCYFLTVNSH